VWNNIANKLVDSCKVFRQGDNVVGLLGSVLIAYKILLVIVRNSVDLAYFTDCSKELISWDRGLTLKVGKPENLSILIFQWLYDLSADIIIYDVFKVNQVEIVSPGMKDTETLVLDSLDSIFLNVLLNEFVRSFICRDGVAEVVCINLFLWIADEGADCFYARRRLKVLIFDLGVKQTSKSIELRKTELFA
jgi:hypothetical protein